MTNFETIMMLLECLMFGMGILYGWAFKERYPGNPEGHGRESKIYDKGYNQGFKVGVEYGKKKLLGEFISYKADMEEEK